MDLMRNIELIICEDRNIDPKLLHSKCRRKQYIEAKYIIIYLSDIFSENSLTRYALGKYFQMNHASATHAIQKINDYIKIYPNFRLQIESYKRKVAEMMKRELPVEIELIILAKQKIRECLLMNKPLEDINVRKYNNLISTNVLKSNKSYEIIEEKL